MKTQKKIHQFINHRTNVNTIWKMHDYEGEMVSSFKDIERVWVEHF
jgi:hypothetical protein